MPDCRQFKGENPEQCRLFDVDAVPREIFAIRASHVSKGWETGRHKHRKAQLIYAVRGTVNCEVAQGMWLVPAQSAVWIPGDTYHSARGGDGETCTECYCLFVEQDAIPGLPETCCTLQISPLMRELLMQASQFEMLYPEQGTEDRLAKVLLDQLASAPVENLHLPLPSDVRLRKLTEYLLDEPQDKTRLTDWAVRVGMSERSLTRALRQELGMSFGDWRRQLHVILALQRLTQGESVQTVALDLGYESASGFVTMFRKTLGKPPARYLAEMNMTPEPPVQCIALESS